MKRASALILFIHVGFFGIVQFLPFCDYLVTLRMFELGSETILN
jgi:hypothetical protein